MDTQADVIIIGAGITGLVAAHELINRGKRVLLLEQEPAQSLGGQAHWSFGGLFFVNSPLQRRMGIKDSYELALQDWMGTAGFDRAEDLWPKQWAEAYVAFAAGEKYSWLRQLGFRFFPVVGWAERGGYSAAGPGNSVPRFHITWGTGPAVVAPFAHSLAEACKRGQAEIRYRHQVDDLVLTNGVVTAVRGSILEECDALRGEKSSRNIIGEFLLEAPAVIITSGGIGGNHELVRKNWPERLGAAPKHMLSGVPEHVDGRMIGIAGAAGASIINPDRMWHYTEGLKNWDPIWKDHAIRILPGPSSMWFDATGKRLPPPLFPGFDTLGTLKHIMVTGHDYTWFILNQSIIRKEFALSGSEQNPDLTGKNWRMVLGRVFNKGATAAVEAFKEHGEDFVVRNNLEDLVAGMNALAGNALLSYEDIARELEARDRDTVNAFGKDMQVTAIRGARKYLGDRLVRTAPLHRILDPAHGPLIAVRLHIMTRKTLGGIQTNLEGAVLNAEGHPIPGLYAAGEAAGFGGGGMHGYRALEGTFLGGCIFSGRVAGRYAG